MQVVRQKAERVACTDVTVLIQGQGGTGKETLARWIHTHSPWKDGPFVKVNCAAIPSTLLESELFGHEKGVFTGAHNLKPGRVEMARSGTLFLDEIAEIDHGLQAKLLQFLQDGHFSRIGDNKEQKVEVRVICASNRRLEKEIDKGRFRADLFYRINGLKIELPLLRDRREDVPGLVEYFQQQYELRFAREAPPPSAQMMQRLQNADWPGNIRELENHIARYVILGPDEQPESKSAGYVRQSFKTFAAATNGAGTIPLKRIAKEAVQELERKLIFEVLKTNHWNRKKTAEALQISYRTLISKIQHANLGTRRGAPHHSAKTDAESE